MLKFIDVIVYNKTKQNVPGSYNTSSLSISDKSYPDRLCVIGVLPHNSEISFDKENAQKMIDFCQKIIDS